MGKIKIQKKDVWIDMTPMSDVMTLLLCFFMLTATFIQPEPVKVNTPSSVTEAKVPDTYVLNILVGPDGKVFLSASGKEHMRDMLLDVASQHNIQGYSQEQLANFDAMSMAGADIDMMGEILNLDPAKAQTYIAQLGVPVDSIVYSDGTKGPSQFQQWVKAARNVELEDDNKYEITIKCDATTKYENVKKVMSNLQDIDENRYKLVTNLKPSEDK